MLFVEVMSVRVFMNLVNLLIMKELFMVLICLFGSISIVMKVMVRSVRVMMFMV